MCGQLQLPDGILATSDWGSAMLFVEVEVLALAGWISCLACNKAVVSELGMSYFTSIQG